MVTSAKLKYIRMSPRKFRLIIPLVKGKNPDIAMSILAGVKKNAARYCEDILKSALANAKRIQGLDASTLYISKLVADGGPMLKRFRAASMGRAGMIKKRTTHITIELDAVKEPSPKGEAARGKLKKVEESTGVVKDKAKVKSKNVKVQVKSKKPKK